MDSINGENKSRDSGDPMRTSIEDTEKGERAKEADELMREALLLITFLARMKDERKERKTSMRSTMRIGNEEPRER